MEVGGDAGLGRPTRSGPHGRRWIQTSLVANALAEWPLGGGTLGVTDGRIHASAPDVTPRLRKAIAAAGSRNSASRSSGAVGLAVLVSPLHVDHVLERCGRTTAAALSITDPDATVPDAAEWNQAADQLTATEARACGTGFRLLLHQAAGRRGISVNTARWHTKHVTGKTGVCAPVASGGAASAPHAAKLRPDKSSRPPPTCPRSNPTHLGGVAGPSQCYSPRTPRCRRALNVESLHRARGQNLVAFLTASRTPSRKGS